MPNSQSACAPAPCRFSSAGPFARRTRYFTVPETPDQVIVDHAHGLHEGVTDGASHELEAPPLQGLAHGIRFRRLGRHFHDRPPRVLLRLTAYEPPNVCVKSAELVLHGQKHLRILDSS